MTTQIGLGIAGTFVILIFVLPALLPLFADDRKLSGVNFDRAKSRETQTFGR